MTDGLRQQAIEAMWNARKASSEESMRSLGQLLAAAEPFIRAQVVAEIVAWMRAPSHPVVIHEPPSTWRGLGDFIERAFGGTDAR